MMANKDPFCQFGQLCDHPRIKYTLPRTDSGLKKIQSFRIENYTRRMCVFADALWLPCCLDNCIMVYSFDGVLLQVVKNFKIEKPYALWEYNDKHLFVAADNGMFLLEDPPRGMGKTTVFDTDNNGEMVTKIREGSFCDVYMTYPYAVFLEYKQGKVFVITYKQAYGRHTEVTTTIKLNFETDYLDSAFMKGQNVYVSSCTQHSVFKYNMKGVCLAQYGQQGSVSPGYLMYPTICSTLNKQGLIIIADAMNDRIQATDEAGTWYILYDNGVKRPVDAVLVDHNILMVLSGKLNDYKVHKFEIITCNKVETDLS